MQNALRYITATPLFLNLGGGPDQYEGWTNVDLSNYRTQSLVVDLTKPWPWLKDSVDRLLTEHFLEHLSEQDCLFVLSEARRVLKPCSLFRIAVPDYLHPGHERDLRDGKDHGNAEHLTLFTKPLLAKLLREAGWWCNSWRQYWENGVFVNRGVSYELAYVDRTPENDKRNRVRPMCITSLVVDCWK